MKQTTLTPKQRIKHITKWIKSYARSAKIDTLVVGISGGIDSSVVSALMDSGMTDAQTKGNWVCPTLTWNEPCG